MLAKMIGVMAMATPDKGLVPSGALSRMEGSETGLLTGVLNGVRRALEASFRQVAEQ